MKKVSALAIFSLVIIVLAIGSSVLGYPAGTATGPGTTTGLLGFSKEHQWVSVQALEDSGAKMGPQVAANYVQFVTSYMTSFVMDGVSYIFFMARHGDDGIWQIRPVLPTGDLGFMTDSGTWKTVYSVLVPVQVDGKQYIWCHNEQRDGSAYWSIQEINNDGTMGNQTDYGHWGKGWYYPTAVPIQAGGKQYIFLHNDHGGGWYSIIPILSGGKLGAQTDAGQWDTYYPTAVPVQFDGKQYIWLHNNDQGGYWSILEILSGGKKGEQTDANHWGHYYCKTVAPIQADGKHYIFGQQEADKTWIIRQIYGNGTLDRNNSDSGRWSYYYDFAFPVFYDPYYIMPWDLWMTEIFPIIKDKALKDIVIAGSHDSGMSVHPHCWLGCACNTMTQVQDIGDQLASGVRYIDFRPVRLSSSDYNIWYTGHMQYIHEIYHGYGGCVGQPVLEVLDNIRTYLQKIGKTDPQNKELVIVSFSHCYQFNISWLHIWHDGRECSQFHFDQVVEALAYPELSEYMLNLERFESDPTLLQTVPYEELIGEGGGKVIFLVHNDDFQSKFSEGIINAKYFPIYNEYSNCNDLWSMISDQKNKLLNTANHENQLFLLSWTLTLSKDEVVACDILEEWRPILDYAWEAKNWLMGEVVNWRREGLIVNNQEESTVPNIIYTDACIDVGARLAVYLNRSLYGGSYDAELRSMSPEGELVTVSKGQTSKLSVEFVNTGTRPWDPGVVHLGTAAPPFYDRDTNLHIDDGNWLSQTRIRMQGDQLIMPGDSARFTFQITPGEGFTSILSLQSFELVADSPYESEKAQWFGDNGRVEFPVFCISCK